MSSPKSNGASRAVWIILLVFTIVIGCLFFSDPNGFISAITGFFTMLMSASLVVIVIGVVFVIIACCFPGVLVFLAIAVVAIVIFFVVAFLSSIF